MPDHTRQMNDRLECEDFVAFVDGRSTDKIRVLTFEGKIGSNNSYEINRKIHQLFENTEMDYITDLAKLEYMNSTGVAVLFSLYFRISEAGHQFLVGSLHPFLDRIFSLMDLPPGFEIVGDTQTALERLQGS